MVIYINRVSLTKEKKYYYLAAEKSAFRVQIGIYQFSVSTCELDNFKNKPN